MQPLLDIIIPVYNGSEYLDSCIASVVSQSYPSLHIIIVDDGSTDHSIDICRKWHTQDKRISLVRQSNHGLSHARNHGLDMCRGEYVAFVDADDVLHPDFATRMVSLCQCADIARCGTVIGSTPRWPRSQHGSEACGAASAIERLLYQRGWHNAVWAHLYRRTIFDGLRFREGTMYEDLDLIYRIYARAAQGVASTSEALYFYRRHPGSMLATFTPSRLQALEVADRLMMHFTHDSRLAAAARARRFSVYCNMLGLAARHLSASRAEQLCWPAITQMRGQVLRDKHARLKNRIGALLSYLGPSIAISISKRLIR